MPNMISFLQRYSRSSCGPLDLEQEGFFAVTIDPPIGGDAWIAMQQWCIKNFPKSYTWTGNIFWFENQEQATYFKLCWR